MQTGDSPYLHRTRASWGNFTLCKHELWPLTNSRPVFSAHTQMSTRHLEGNVWGKNTDLSEVYTKPGNTPQWGGKKILHLLGSLSIPRFVSLKLHRSVNTLASDEHTRLCETPLTEEWDQIFTQGHVSEEYASNLEVTCWMFSHTLLWTVWCVLFLSPFLL